MALKFVIPSCRELKFTKSGYHYDTTTTMTLFIRVINWNYFVIYKQFFRHHCHALQLHATLSSFTTLQVLIAYFLYSLYSIRTLGLGGA